MGGREVSDKNFTHPLKTGLFSFWVFVQYNSQAFIMLGLSLYLSEPGLLVSGISA